MRHARASVVARVALTPIVVGVLYLLRANVWFRLYPAVMSAIALAVFALSLADVPLVERVARGMGETLDGRGVHYCRRVTQVWTAFLAANLIVAVATVFAPREIWALYNGCVSYVLMGLLFVVEWIVRRKVRRG